MLNIINDIIDVSKIESGQLNLNISTFNINELLRTQFDFFINDSRMKNLAFNCQYLESSISTIESDKTKIEQVFTNLIKNAFKFTEKGEIEFGVKLDGDLLVGYVKDTGSGIKREKQQIIFDRFRQGDIDLTRPYEGAGLGLSISKGFIDLLGGKIWVESDELTGSIFQFTFPYIEGKMIQATKNKRDDTINITEDYSILLVEDDLTSMEYLKKLVSIINIKYYTASNGKIAIEELKKHPNISIVLMDLRMPEMDGFEAVKKMKLEYPNIPVIAQTANAFSEDKYKALQAGFDDYLSKPIRKEDLYDKLMKFLLGESDELNN